MSNKGVPRYIRRRFSADYDAIAMDEGRAAVDVTGSGV